MDVIQAGVLSLGPPPEVGKIRKVLVPYTDQDMSEADITRRVMVIPSLSAYRALEDQYFPPLFILNFGGAFALNEKKEKCFVLDINVGKNNYTLLWVSYVVIYNESLKSPKAGQSPGLPG